MGFFSKKQPPALVAPKKAVGTYVAPRVSPTATALTPQAAPAGQAVARPTGQVAYSEPTIPGPHLMNDDLEQAMLPSSDDTKTQDNLTAMLEDDDDPTVDDDNDTRTFRTEFTAPTLRSVRSEETKDSAFTITKNGQYLTMNGFANGHLMRWKFAAEEGPAFIRFPAILLALTVIGTTLYPIVVNTFYWTPSSIICAFHTCVLASLIFVLEGRVLVGSRAPTSFRARVRAVVTRYINLFRLLWGRGLLYIFVATMNMTIDHPFALWSGSALAVFGLLAIASGAHASYNLDKMKTSLTDEAYLWSKFDALDADNDNYIDLNEFAELLWALGLEFDDAYTYKAFSQINGDPTSKITFEQFRDWWIVTQNKGRVLRNSTL